MYYAGAETPRLGEQWNCSFFFLSGFPTGPPGLTLHVRHVLPSQSK